MPRVLLTVILLLPRALWTMSMALKLCSQVRRALIAKSSYDWARGNLENSGYCQCLSPWHDGIPLRSMEANPTGEMDR
jgi:hypothetical protein